MRLLLYNTKSYVAANGKFIFLLFTTKLIMLRIIWLILATHLLMVCTFLIHHIEACPIGCTMIL
ncbi:hypothetical protein LINGRAHAP2_LOCUS2086 [Linum grandiflorum]